MFTLSDIPTGIANSNLDKETKLRMLITTYNVFNGMGFSSLNTDEIIKKWRIKEGDKISGVIRPQHATSN